MTNPFVFVVGCSRSGTTLLQHILDAHSRIGILPETRWFARWFEERYGLTAENFVGHELVERLLEKHRLFRGVDLGIQPKELHRLVGSGRALLYQELVG